MFLTPFFAFVNEKKGIFPFSPFDEPAIPELRLILISDSKSYQNTVRRGQSLDMSVDAAFQSFRHNDRKIRTRHFEDG
jgi:hypothetical protein